MSWVDSVLSDSVGVLWRAGSGTVDPWTLQAQKDEVNAGIAQASGPNATAAQVAIAQEQASVDMERVLTASGTHPSQAGIRIPGLGNIGSPEFLGKMNKIVDGLLIAGAVAGVVYFYSQYRSIFGKR
jgi:hypothetical protein